MAKNYSKVKSKINRSQLNPLFHFQDKKEDCKVLSKAMIKQAKKSGSLNLASKGLGTVPDKVWNMNSPDDSNAETRYDLDNSNEDDLWWNQKTLTNLDLSSNALTEISCDVQNLLDLTVLNLQDNALTTLPKELGQLQYLTRLNVSHNKLNQLPAEFFRLPKLVHLNLSHNECVDLCPDISDLVMLEVLDLSYNQLTTLPGGIGFLVRLNELMLSHNRLVELPMDLVNLRSLNKLDVIHNDLKALPDRMGDLRKLECLYAQHNNIVELPNFVGCEMLKEIHIANNFIKSVPAEFCENLPQLKILDLRDNKIEQLPDEIAMLQSLLRLDLSNNSINSLPSGLSSLANLVSLQLEGNPIRSIRRDIIQCGTARILKTLRDRDGKSNKVQTSATIEEKVFPDRYQMQKNHSLCMTNRALLEIPEFVFNDALAAKVHSVDFSKNKLPAFPSGLTKLSHLLGELNASSNLISAVAPEVAQFDRISYINLACNLLEDLPAEFGQLVSLRELNINCNRFKRIPPCVFELKNLEILLARDNKIEEIDAAEEGLAGLKLLATLDLANNNIGHVPPILGNMKQIKTLEITGNSFRQPRHQILAKGTESIMAYLRDRIPQ